MAQASFKADDKFEPDGAARNSPPAILAVNPGSTSTRLAMFRGWEEAEAFEMEWKLPRGLRGKAMEEEIGRYVAHIQQFLAQVKVAPQAVVGRGGFIDCSHHKLASGVYEVAVMRNGRAEICADICRSVVEAPEMDHAANYGIPVAAKIATIYNIPAFTADPIVVDDFSEVACLSGYTCPFSGAARRTS